MNNPVFRFVDAGKLAISDARLDVVLPDSAKLFEALYVSPRFVDKYSTQSGPLQ